MISLQSVGQVETVKVKELMKGDLLMFNFGLLNTVEGFGKETVKFIEVYLYSHEQKETNLVRWSKDKEVCKV